MVCPRETQWWRGGIRQDGVTQFVIIARSKRNLQAIIQQQWLTEIISSTLKKEVISTDDGRKEPDEELVDHTPAFGEDQVPIGCHFGINLGLGPFTENMNIG